MDKKNNIEELESQAKWPKKKAHIQNINKNKKLFFFQ